MQLKDGNLIFKDLKSFWGASTMIETQIKMELSVVF